ncbi:MAG: hypothetical protein GC159_19675 [Phycisphaera sp.]|nr:hypothetical protein [Phycisphaera sp.]
MKVTFSGGSMDSQELGLDGEDVFDLPETVRVRTNVDLPDGRRITARIEEYSLEIGPPAVYRLGSTQKQQ